MSELISTISKLLNKLKTKILSFISFVASLLFYLIGIGLTRIFSLFAGKNFLENDFTNSSWKKGLKKINLKKKF